MATDQQATFDNNDTVDFVIVGSGSAGGIIAKELSTSGFRVVVLEQGPFRRAEEFTHDEIDVIFNDSLHGDSYGQTFRPHASAEAVTGRPAQYAQTVGGSSVHFTANFWRLREIDFREKSVLGPISGTNFADWPISYAELEPYYSRVDYEIGVSGAPGPFDSFRSRPFATPPIPVNSSGVLLERGARKMGLHAQPAPLAILSKPMNGRPACINCGFCMGFGCEVGAKSSTLAAVIPMAQASGNCEIRANCAVSRVLTNAAGRVTEVVYLDGDMVEHSQKASAVILSANGAETPRLLLNSANNGHPDGLANSSGFVGRNLMFNGHSMNTATFEHQLNDFKGVQVTRIIHDFYETDPKRGFYGGGGIDARALLAATPLMYALYGSPRSGRNWGADFKATIARDYTRELSTLNSTTSLPQDSNNVTIHPSHKDKFGRPSLCVTYTDHADDLAMAKFLQQTSHELLEAAGAEQIWDQPIHPQTGNAHLLGTCRMGNDPGSSVIDRFHRTHDVPNLFICDGSSMVTSGRGQPTMTIMALAYRASEHIAAAAKNNEI